MTAQHLQCLIVAYRANLWMQDGFKLHNRAFLVFPVVCSMRGGQNSRNHTPSFLLLCEDDEQSLLEASTISLLNFLLMAV